MTAFNKFKQKMINRIAALSIEEKQSIMAEMNQLESAFKAFNDVLIEHAGCVAAALFTSWLVRDFIPQKLLTTNVAFTLAIKSTLFRRYGWLVERENTSPCKMYYDSIIAATSDLNLSAMAIKQAIITTKKEVMDHTSRFNSVKALQWAVAGLSLNTLINLIPPLPSYNIIYSFPASLTFSLLGRTMGGARRKIDAPQTANRDHIAGLSLNDILVTIYHYITSNLNGFNFSLEGMNNDADKRRFIALCQHLVDHGWDTEFEKRIAMNTEQDAYFWGVIKHILVKPLSHLFNHRSDLSPASERAIIALARLQLLRLLFETRLTQAHLFTITDDAWFKTNKEQLGHEFSAASNVFQIKYNGRVIKTTTDFSQATDWSNQTRKKHAQIIAPLVFVSILIFVIANAYREHLPPPLVSLVLPLLTIALSYFYIRPQQNELLAANQFLRTPQASDHSGPQEIQARIGKFFLIQEADLKLLAGPNTTGNSVTQNQVTQTQLRT